MAKVQQVWVVERWRFMTETEYDCSVVHVASSKASVRSWIEENGESCLKGIDLPAWFQAHPMRVNVTTTEFDWDCEECIYDPHGVEHEGGPEFDGSYDDSQKVTTEEERRMFKDMMMQCFKENPSKSAS